MTTLNTSKGENKVLYLFENILKIVIKEKDSCTSIKLDIYDMPIKLRQNILDDEDIVDSIEVYIKEHYLSADIIEMELVRDKPQGNAHVWKEILGYNKAIFAIKGCIKYWIQQVI